MGLDSVIHFEDRKKILVFLSLKRKKGGWEGREGCQKDLFSEAFQCTVQSTQCVKAPFCGALGPEL